MEKEEYRTPLSIVALTYLVGIWEKEGFLK